MSLEIKKKELDLRRVETARFEMELRIAERQEEIQRLQANIKIQEEAEQKLKKEIQEMRNK